MAFWSDSNLNPKRKNRFLVTIGDLPQYLAKSAGKPSFSINNHEHNFLNHKFNFPGMISWDPIEITFVDAGDSGDDTASALYQLLTNSGYVTPGDENAARNNAINKSSATSAAGQIIIEQIDETGSPIETSTLHNAWIESVSFGDVSYEDDGIVELTVSIRYDWAEIEG